MSWTQGMTLPALVAILPASAYVLWRAGSLAGRVFASSTERGAVVCIPVKRGYCLKGGFGNLSASPSVTFVLFVVRVLTRHRCAPAVSGFPLPLK